jgi:hypothetical protein
MRRVAFQALLCLLCSGLAMQAAAAKKHAPVQDRSAAGPNWFHYPQFTDAEARLVVNWCQDRLEAGRTRISSIPTAIPSAVARQMHIGAKLTASMVKSLAAPPADLVEKLLPLPDGYQRLLAGSVLVILKTDEDLVVDTLAVGRR